MMYENIFLLLGSNLGDRLKNLDESKKFITSQGVEFVRQSSVYETGAWGKIDQPDYLNQMIMVSTALSPAELLDVCLSIEKKMGRVRDTKWAARTIDIDIIYFGEQIIKARDLKIPHPRMAERKFVLTPLVEIAPNFLHPILMKTNLQLLNECDDNLAVKTFTS